MRKRHGAAGAAQARRLGKNLQVVAPQHHGALYGDFFNGGNGKTQPEPVIGHPGRRGLGQHLVRNTPKGRGIHHRQPFGQRALYLGIHIHGGAAVQMADHPVDLAHTQARPTGQVGARELDLQHRTVHHQLARCLRQSGPGQAVFGHHTAWCVVIHHVLQVGRNTEVALFGGLKRKILQPALDLEFDPRRTARRD